jgi:peptidoglycan/LPS O-acetylase OafA/YrhL
VLLSALILGPLMTTLPLQAYFSDPLFFSYFFNAVGYIHFSLPGLFLANPTPNIVNGQLWTVPRELQCYLLLTALALIRFVGRKLVFLLIVIALGAFFWVKQLLAGPMRIDPFHIAPADVLICAFLAGVATYNYREIVPWSAGLFALCALLVAGLLSLPYGDYFIPLPAAYATVYLGLLNPPKTGVLRGADYSYGLFLYGYAIQQSVAWLGPWTHHWYVNLALALPMAAVFAALSWTLVEKPALRLRRHLPAIERALAALPFRRRIQRATP